MNNIIDIIQLRDHEYDIEFETMFDFVTWKAYKRVGDYWVIDHEHEWITIKDMSDEK